ncbi:MAG: response regulator [Planctomycetaceae bacterium]
MKILIAEDSATTRTALAGMLSSWGFDVCQVADGAAAWKEFEQFVFPIVLTDWQMPEVDGMELIRRIRAQENTGFVYTILLTARAATSDVVWGMEHGADAYLVKPADPDELRARIQAGVRIVQLEQRLERRRQELVDAETQILEAEKLAGIGQLAAGMAHEVNNPIAVVSGNLDVFSKAIRSLLDVLDAWELGREHMASSQPGLLQTIDDLMAAHDLPWLRQALPTYLESTHTNVQRVCDVISRLQDFSWHDKARMDQIDPVQAVQTAISVLGAELARAQVSIAPSFQAVPPLTCHPARFNQALYNVLHNAIQASGINDVVDVTIFFRQDQIVIQIADRGPGIPIEVRPRIFQPFFTTRAVGAGSGLGLAFSHRVIQEAGGSISCAPRSGGGTVFEIRIPVTNSAPAKSDNQRV